MKQQDILEFSKWKDNKTVLNESTMKHTIPEAANKLKIEIDDFINALSNDDVDRADMIFEYLAQIKKLLSKISNSKLHGNFYFREL